MNRTQRILEAADFLEDYDEMFSDFVRVSAIHIDPSIPTACIQFDPTEGKPVAMAFNPDYVDGLDDYTLAFLVAHEITHAYLKHGIRGRGLKDKEKANITMDISVNHYLVDQLKFDRSRVMGQERLCWVDTVLKQPVPHHHSFEYYYNLDDSLFNQGYTTMEDHGGLGGFNPADLPKDIKEMFAESGSYFFNDRAGL